jgi:hypothetical protein
MWKQTRQERIADPDVQKGIDEEWERVKASFGRLGNQTKISCAAVIYNALIRPLVPIRKGKEVKLDPAKQIVDGAVDSTAKTLALVARILLATGRATKYGIRRALVL